MRLSSSIMFLVATVAVLLTFNGAESFNLGRKVTISLDLDDHVDSSNETNGTDGHLLDSLELIQNNETSIEDVLDIHQHHNSLETNNNRRLIKQDFKLALPNQTTNASLVLKVTDDDNLSLEDIAFLEQQKNKTNDTIVRHQQLHLLIGTLKVKSDLVKRNAPTADHFVIQQQDGLSSHGVETVQQRFDDHSLEDQQHFVLSHEDILLLSLLEQQPIVGVFGHPLSDDLYLVKEYLGDYYFWEMDDELSRAYLMRWVTVQDITKFVSNLDTRPKKTTADHFAQQFTPVLPMTDDEIHALSPVIAL